MTEKVKQSGGGMTEEKNKKEETQEVKIPAKFKDIVEQIEKMSVIDLAELVKILEEKFGVSREAPMAAMVQAPAAGEASASGEEQTTFNIELTQSGDNKIGVIKAIREITQIGLKEAKDLVDGAPKMVREGVGKEEAAEIKKKLEAAGAKVTLK